MDDPGLLVQTALMAVLLLFSAFFSGSETAFFSLNSLEKDALRTRTRGKRRTVVAVLFRQPDEVLVTILTGNMFVNIFSTSISEALGARFFGESAELISIAAMTLTLLIVGEMTPKNFAIRHSLGFSVFAERILNLIYPVLRPIVVPLGAIRKLVLSAYPENRRADAEARNLAVLSAIRMGFENDTIDQSELALLERFFRFREKTAADVMIPRIDLVSADAASSVDELIEKLRDNTIGSDVDLIPLHKSDLDHITGYVRRVDLVSYRVRGETDVRLAKLSRDVYAVPASKPLRELAVEMINSSADLSVVVDEYGGTLGVVSYTAMVDYLFDTFRRPEDRAVRLSSDGIYRFAGSVEIKDVEETLGVEFGCDARTIGGMIVERLGELPAVGDSVECFGYTLTVSESDGRRASVIEARPGA